MDGGSLDADGFGGGQRIRSDEDEMGLSKADANAQTQDIMEEGEEEQQLDFERHPLAEDFYAALECLRISPSHPGLVNSLARFRPQFREFFCRALTSALTKIRENAAAEFRSICEENGLLDALSTMCTSDVSDTEIGQSIAPQEAVREIAVNRKQQELNALRGSLQKTKDDNAVLSTQLEDLREKVAEAQHLRSFTDKVSGINAVIQQAMR